VLDRLYAYAGVQPVYIGYNANRRQKQYKQSMHVRTIRIK